MTTITIDRCATLTEVLATLVVVGADTFMQATGLESHAEALAFGQMTARRQSYDAASWESWSALLAAHSEDLRAMAAADSAALMVRNAKACEVVDALPLPASF